MYCNDDEMYVMIMMSVYVMIMMRYIVMMMMRCMCYDNGNYIILYNCYKVMFIIIIIILMFKF
jgi:hypothetical protein